MATIRSTHITKLSVLESWRKRCWNSRPGSPKPVQMCQFHPVFSPYYFSHFDPLATSKILASDPLETYNRVPLSNLTETLPQMHFQEYFSSFAPRAFPSTVILDHPPFFSSLSPLLAETANSTVEAYLVARAALSLAHRLSPETKPWIAVHSLEKKLMGIKNSFAGDRAGFCVEQVQTAFGFATGRYFVREKLLGESKEKATKIVASKVSSSVINKQ